MSTSQFVAVAALGAPAPPPSPRGDAALAPPPSAPPPAPLDNLFDGVLLDEEDDADAVPPPPPPGSPPGDAGADATPAPRDADRVPWRTPGRRVRSHLVRLHNGVRERE